MVFATPRVLRLQGRSDFVTVDDLGNIAVPLPAARLHYTVESEPEIGDPRRADVADARQPADPRWQARYTQLPPVSPRIAALAREVTAGSADRYEAAQRLTAWLSRELTYTRVLERVDRARPAGGVPVRAAQPATASTSPPRWRSCCARSASRPAWSTASSAASGIPTASTSWFGCATPTPGWRSSWTAPAG